MTKYLFGNWKMNGDKILATHLLEGIYDYTVNLNNVVFSVFPPYPYIHLCSQKSNKSNFKFGAQNVSQYPYGAFTGEVSASMLVDYGCTYVLIGHSERRHTFGETDEILSQKLLAAIKAGLIPVLCIGEQHYDRIKGEYIPVLKNQLEGVFNNQNRDLLMKNCIIAYEPVWSIGTGLAAKTSDIVPVTEYIRDYFSTRNHPVTLLYGGSVTPDNTEEIMSVNGIDGLLVGGASLTLDKFLKIGDICNLL